MGSIYNISIALFLTFVCSAFVGDAVLGQDRPNVILIMADDLGYGDISPYRGWIKTPNLERLSKEGMTFSDFHSSGNVCSPTRAGLLTGRYQQRLGLDKVVLADPTKAVHYHGIPDSETTIAESFRDGGYQTAIFGKWHVGYEPEYNPVLHGFDKFRGYVSGNVDFFSHVDQAGKLDWWNDKKIDNEPGYTTDLITKHAKNFIRENAKKPFFLYLPHEAPHYPYQGPNDQPLRTVGGKFNNQGARKDIKNAYTEMVQRMDKGIGEILDLLEELKLRENTFVIFLSDNGANQRGSNAPLRGSKGSNWEGGHRVPGIFSWPAKIPKNESTDQLAISIDIFPTVLAACKIPTKPELKVDGENLMGVLTKSSKSFPRKLYWNGKAMRDGNYKLVIGKPKNAKAQLFDLSKDIGEKTDISKENPTQLKKMRASLNAWIEDVSKPKPRQPYAEAEKKAAKALKAKKSQNAKKSKK